MSPDHTSLNKFDDFPLRHNGVGEVQAAIFPLNGAVQIQSVTQPVIRGTPKNVYQKAEKLGQTDVFKPKPRAVTCRSNTLIYLA